LSRRRIRRPEQDTTTSPSDRLQRPGEPQREEPVPHYSKIPPWAAGFPVRPPDHHAPGDATNASGLGKILGNEDELTSTPGVMTAAVVPMGGEPAPDVPVQVEQTTTDATATSDSDRDRALAKAAASVAAGAAPSHALGAREYGFTSPESVVPDITAKQDASGMWSPTVTALRGRFSMQTRLLPGQNEITGPTGNTTDANHCDQVTNLQSLGNIAGSTWYMLSAVKRHEQVHADHFLPALVKAEPAITASLEAVKVPDAPKMTAAQAVVALKADATFQAAVANAQALWLASILVEVAGDHAAGGPCDKAEQTVTEPMRKTICDFAAANKWAACAAC
jgi:hypothetical protein